MDLSTLTAEELTTLLSDVRNELDKRITLATAEDRIDAIVKESLQLSGEATGDDWKQPTGPRNAYPKGWKVKHAGKTWVSTIPVNVWPPGVEGWQEEVVPGAAPPQWVQPGSTNPYLLGQRVTFQGKVYESTHPANVWSPTAYPQGWKLIP